MPNLVYVMLIVYAVKYSAAYYMGRESSKEYYIDEDLEQESERICTQCSEDHPECLVEFHELWTNYSDWDGWWSCETDLLCPWDLSEEFLMMDCSDHSERKKRHSVQAGTHVKYDDGRFNTDLSHNVRHRSLHPHRRKRDAHEWTYDIIYINRASLGVSIDSIHGDCDAVHHSNNDHCEENALYHREHLLHCNGQSECWELGLPSPEVCYKADHSDFLQVDYQCIPEELVLRVDWYQSITSHVGYVMSTSYPYHYTPECSYQCVITFDYQKLLYLEFDVLDFHLESDDNGCCSFDWLEVQSINKYKQIVQRRRFCGVQDQTSMLEVSQATVRLLFETDHKTEERGFWIKYSAYDETSEELEVSIACDSYDPSNDHLFELLDDVEIVDNFCYDRQTTEQDFLITTPDGNYDQTSPDIGDSTEEESSETTETDDESDFEDHTTLGKTTEDHTTPGLVTDVDPVGVEEQSSKSSSSTVGIAVGAAVAGLVVIGVIITTVAVICHRNRNCSSKSSAPASASPAYNNPYYLPPSQGKPAMGHQPQPSVPFQSAGVDNPGYNSGYLYPVNQPPKGIGIDPADNTQYEEIPASVASFGVPSTGYEQLKESGNRNTAVEGSKDTSVKGNAQEEANVYQELIA